MMVYYQGKIGLPVVGKAGFGLTVIPNLFLFVTSLPMDA